MQTGVWTKYYLKDRLADKIARKAWQMGLFKTCSYYPMRSYATGEEIGVFVRISGNGLVVWFIDKITEPKLSRKDRIKLAEILRSMRGLA